MLEHGMPKRDAMGDQVPLRTAGGGLTGSGARSRTPLRGTERGGTMQAGDEVEELRRQVEALTARVGEGEHEQSVMGAVTQALMDHERRVAQVEMVVYQSWELKPCTVTARALDMQRKYHDACKAAKGTQRRVGHCKNYTFMGLLMGTQEMQMPKGVQEGLVGKLRELLLMKCGNKDGEVDITKATELESVVAYAQVVKGKEVVYLNIRLQEPERALERELETLWASLGRRQWDPPPPKPVVRELRKWRDTHK